MTAKEYIDAWDKGVENQKVFMFKIKTLKWLQKVRDLYGNERTD